MTRYTRLLLLFLLPLSSFATGQKTVVDYFILLPQAAFVNTSVWGSVKMDVFSPAGRKRMLTDFGGQTLPPGAKADSKAVNLFTISKIDTAQGLLSLHDQQSRGAHINMWREAGGNVLIGVLLIHGAQSGTRNELSFYRYDGKTMAKVEDLLPRLTISEFVKKDDLEADSISPALVPHVLYSFPDEGRTIECRVEFAFWGSGSDASGDEKPYRYLTARQAHEVTLQYTPVRFKVMKK